MKQKLQLDIIILSILFSVAACASVAVFVFAAYLPARSFAPFSTLLTIDCVMIASSLYRKGLLKRCILRCNGLALLISFTLIFTLSVDDVLFIHHIYSEQISAFDQAESDNSAIAYIPNFYSRTKYTAPYGLDSIQKDPNSWPNNSMADYYGVPQVISAN